MYKYKLGLTMPSLYFIFKKIKILFCRKLDPALDLEVRIISHRKCNRVTAEAKSIETDIRQNKKKFFSIERTLPHIFQGDKIDLTIVNYLF